VLSSHPWLYLNLYDYFIRYFVIVSLQNLKANSLFPEYEKWRQMNDPTVAPIPVNLAYQLLFPYDGSPCGCPLTSTVGGSPFPCVAFLEAPDQVGSCGGHIWTWVYLECALRKRSVIDTNECSTVYFRVRTSARG